MFAGLPAVIEDVGIRATGILQGVPKDWHAIEAPLVVDGLSKFGDCTSVPVPHGRVEQGRPERVAGDTAEQASLVLTFTVRVAGGFCGVK
jgi:hypothetical protein